VYFLINIQKNNKGEKIMKSLIFENVTEPINVELFMQKNSLEAACAITVDGKRVGRNFIIEKPCEISIYTFQDEIGKKAYWEATSILLAIAVKKLYPKVKFAGGGNTKNGFYYDFDSDLTFTSDDLAKLEKEMLNLSKIKNIIEPIIQNAKELLVEASETYLVSLYEDAKLDNPIVTYKGEGFYITTNEPVLIRMSKIRNFRLQSSSAAYWKGNEKNKRLQRISGISFENKEELTQYLNLQEELNKRSNKKLGKELELFFFDETAPGMPYWLPKGLKIFNLLVKFWRDEHEARGYQEFSAPQLNDSQLWKTSGHWEHYRKDMFVFKDQDGNEQALKPMSCPNAIKVYQTKLRSYKDLPLRFSDIDVIHRNEKSGELNGMLRVRMFRQDDSHNFIRENQIATEISDILDIANKFYMVFGLSFKVSLSTRPENFVGDIEVWNHAEAELRSVLNKTFGEGNYGIKDGDGAFYGPKIDIQMEDSLGREWQMGTIQLDFQLPKRFDINYIDENGQPQTPIILHRVIYGSLERFIGIITEHFAGVFPLWFAPIQVEIATIGGENHEEYAKNISKILVSNNIRIETNFKRDSIGYKIRYAQTQKIPYTIVIGDNEVRDNTISVRSRKYGNVGTMSIENFVNMLNEKIDGYSLDN
jgi:threonyl-tRNA synthetase